MRTCVHVTATTCENESRLLKEAHSILTHNISDQVVVIARWREGLSEDERIEARIAVKRILPSLRGWPRTPVTPFARILDRNRRIVRLVNSHKPNLLVAHSVATLQACAQAAGQTSPPFVYDCHELETETNGLRGMLRRYFQGIERKYIHKPGAVVVVGEAISDWYKAHYPGISRPFVVRNIPDLRMGTPSRSAYLRHKFSIPDEALVFLFLGFLTSGRRIEDTLAAFEAAGTNHHVVFVGYGDREAIIREAAGRCDRIHLHEAVAPKDVLGVAAGADIGLCALEYTCLSYKYSLPNKLFEYMASGLPVIAGSGPETKAIVERHDCGWIVGDTQSDLTTLVQTIHPEAVQAKSERAFAASSLYSWEHEEKIFLDACKQAIQAVPA